MFNRIYMHIDRKYIHIEISRDEFLHEPKTCTCSSLTTCPSRVATATMTCLFNVVVSSVNVGALVCDTLPEAVDADILLFRVTDEVSE